MKIKGVERQTGKCECGCGCNHAVLGKAGWFVWGHAKSHRAKLETAAANGNTDATVELLARGWGSSVNIPTLKIGIEIEFTGISPERCACAVRSVGIDCRGESYNHQTRTWWKVVPDASCGHELVSPPIMATPENLKIVEKIVKAVRAFGGQVNGNCGVHVHVEVEQAGLTIQSIKRLVHNYQNSRALIDSFMPRSRRVGGVGYCAQYRLEELTTLDNITTLDELAVRCFDRYRMVNLASYPKYKTIEFRQHHGSLSGSKITAWVNFISAMVFAATLNVNTTGVSNLTVFFNKIGLNKNVAKYYKNRAEGFGFAHLTATPATA
jgi:hypothetical protein